MYFFEGLLGLIAAGWALGYLFLKVTGLKTCLPPFAGPFAASLICTNLLIEALVAVGDYVHFFVWPLAVILVICAFTAAILNPELAVIPSLKSQVWNQELPTARRLLVCGIFAATLLFIPICTWLSIGQMQPAIFGYDSISSWNPWALDWAQNKFPGRIYHYPQLVPAMWSFVYVSADDTSLQFFPSFFKILFWVATSDALIFVAKRSRDFLLLASLPILTFLYLRWIG